jgi:flagellar export protein FliJ
MAFRFHLEAVLHLRQSLEHQQELRLRAAIQQVAGARHFIEQIDARLEHARKSQSQQLTSGTTSAELLFDYSRESVLLEQRRFMQRELLRLQNLRDEQQRLFQRARRARETFENLRDHQIREYDRETIRRDQRQLDELFLLRRAHLRQSSNYASLR